MMHPVIINSWMSRIEKALAQCHQKNIYRKRWVIRDGNSRWLQYGSQRYLNFSSNDYLGLTHHPEIIAAWQYGAYRAGAGAGGSGHVIGYSEYHQQLENRLASWLGFPRALLFNSGFSANQAVINAIINTGDHILADQLSHASLLEAAMKSSAELRRFAHNDAKALKKLLCRKCAGNRLVITEGIFSMDGDKSPLVSFVPAIRRAGGWLLVDDAHGIGVVGEEGRGSAWAQSEKPDLLIITFSKAFGVAGAAVLCKTPVAEYLLQFARNLIYSTALPPAQIAAIDTAMTLVRKKESLRQRLRENIAYFRHGAAALKFKLIPSNTAIQPLIIGDNRLTLIMAERLRARGIWLTAILPPTVPPGSSRLRIILTAIHQPEDIVILLEALADVYKEI